MTRQELQSEVYAIERELSAKESERREFISEKLKACEREACAEADSIFKANILDLRCRLMEAERKHGEAMESAGIAGETNGTAYALGTRLLKWERQFRNSYGRKNPYIKATGEVGIVEVIKRDSLHPGNSSNPASVGSVVLRLLKKNGAPSLKYISEGWNFGDKPKTFYDWFPEGVDMKGRESWRPEPQPEGSSTEETK